MPDVKTAAELEANIKRMVGLQRDEPEQQPMRKPSPMTDNPAQDGEMSAFKKFVSFNINTFAVLYCFIMLHLLFYTCNFASLSSI